MSKPQTPPSYPVALIECIRAAPSSMQDNTNLDSADFSGQSRSMASASHGETCSFLPALRQSRRWVVQRSLCGGRIDDADGSAAFPSVHQWSRTKTGRARSTANALPLGRHCWAHYLNPEGPMEPHPEVSVTQIRHFWTHVERMTRRRSRLSVWTCLWQNARCLLCWSGLISQRTLPTPGLDVRHWQGSGCVHGWI